MKSSTVGGMRAAIYARVSSQRQAQADTIASQVQTLRARASEDGLTLDEEIVVVRRNGAGAMAMAARHPRHRRSQRGPLQLGGPLHPGQ
jgi:DNA invertase Pin-like site-specific DNA recombinase